MRITSLQNINFRQKTPLILKDYAANPIKQEVENLKIAQNQHYTDLNKYPNAAYMACDFGFCPPPKGKNYTLSQMRFFETIDKNQPLRLGHFREFKGNKADIIPQSFFIRMKHYKEDMNWAYDMVNLTYFISDLMTNDIDIYEIIKHIELGVYCINDKNKYGVLKSITPWQIVSKGYSIEENKRGEEYLEKYKEKIKRTYSPKPTKEYSSKANTLTIYPDKKTGTFLVLYPDFDTYKDSNMTLVKEIYEDLKEKENPSKNEVVEVAAKIQWLIAQETPYIKGSDSIANVLAKSLMHAYNLPISPLKEGISLDFEAWYQNMDKYVKNYPSYFENNPLR